MGYLKQLACVLAATCVLGSTAQAQEKDFYKGKSINLYIGWAAGSGYDSYSRLAARYLGTHIPGAPNVISLNQPGGGSISLANRLYAALPKDGTAIGMVGNSLYLQQFLGEANIQFDATQFTWIGRQADLPLLLMSWHSSPAKTPADVFTKPYNIGAPGAGSAANLTLAFIKELVGAKYSMILGYQNGAETRLAMERGEIDATASIDWSIFQQANADWLRDKKVNLLAVLGLNRLAEIPDVPLMSDLATKPDDRKLIEVFMSPADIGRAILAPPGLPAERTKTLRDAFDAMAKDEKYIADAQKQSMSLNPMSGESLQKLISQVGDISPELAEKARALSEKIKK